MTIVVLTVQTARVMSRSQFAALPDVDSWLLAPLPVSTSRTDALRIQRQRAEARFLLYSRSARGRMKDLSSVDRRVVKRALDADWSRYLLRCQRDGRRPLHFNRFVRGWKGRAKAHYHYDVRRRLRETFGRAA